MAIGNLHVVDVRRVIGWSPKGGEKGLQCFECDN